MNLFARTWAVFVVAAKRLFSQKWLSLATAAGLIASVALIVSIPLYADGVYYRVLRKALSGERFGARPPFVFMFRYIGAWSEAVEWDRVEQVDRYLCDAAGKALGLPQKLLVRYFETDNFRLFPVEDAAYANVRDPLAWVNFAFATDIEQHINVVEGNLPAVAETAQDSTVEVLISEPLATELGLQVGEEYITYRRRRTDKGDVVTQIPMRIAGVWTPKDPTEEYWFYDPKALKQVLLVPEGTFMGRIAPYVENEVYLGLWYLLMDGSEVHVSDVNTLLVRTASVQQRAAALLPGTRLDISPVPALQDYRRAASLLTVLLYAFSVPVIGLLLAFIGLVVGLAAGQQRNEIAVLRSRGATAIQVLGITALEGVLLGALALAAGLPLGGFVARLIGHTRSFLDFSLPSDLRVGITMTTVRSGIVAVALALIAQIVPTIEAARHTIITYKQERARTLRPPWWQRAWLDVFLFVPAAYGAYLLRRQGGLLLPVGKTGMVNDPFQNPLLFLVPALGIFALTLFMLRLLPKIMSAIAWLSAHLSGVGVLLATRHLSRTPGFYSAPLILLTLTLSLSAFTASLAQTLDHHLYDQTYYKIGADMRLVELGESTESAQAMVSFSSGAASGTTSETGKEEEEMGPRWLFLPVSEHLKVSGVRAATRVGRYKFTTRLSGGTQSGTFIGIDRVEFPQVAFWRHDFAPASLGALMNALAIRSNGVLVPRTFLAQHALNIGDTFRATVVGHGERAYLDLEVVGVFDMFPTWYPDEGPLLVGNLDYFFEQLGWQVPYDVWLKTDAQVDYERIVEDVRSLRLNVLGWDAPQEVIREAQRRPERQGLFGFLSAGFLAAAFLTVLGFLLYAFFSFRQRFIELGVLRAIGLSASQMTSFLAWELALLIGIGMIAGTGLGIWVSTLFIPYLQIGAGPEARTPPFIVEIAWPAIFRIYVLFGLLFLVALSVLVILLLRMKIFQAIKLGETA